VTRDPAADPAPQARPTVDFQALIPQGWSDPGLTIHLRNTLSLIGGERFFAAEISRRRMNDQGRDLKPEHVITICTQPDDSLPALLRLLANLFEQEEPVVVA
jgi:hypothetical protein